MKPTDQLVKLRIVYLTAAFALVGFFLEVGPAGVFPQVATGLRIQVPAFGFLAYLALAAAAAVALHLGEEEPTPREEKTQPPPAQGPERIGEVREYARVRPDLQQLRLLFITLGGYALLKGFTLTLIWPDAVASGVYPLRAFQFGLGFVGIGWFLLIQFLRWHAMRRRWIRLQEELMGVDVSRILALAVLVKPLFFFLVPAARSGLPTGFVYLLIPVLLHLCIAAAAVVLWFARPLLLRRTVTGLAVIGSFIVALTITQAILERILPEIYG